MNIYEKIQQARVELQGMDLKKSGANKFAGYQYFELSDFLPKVNEIFSKHKLFSQVSFTAEHATLTIINAENPEERVEFASPMAAANLKGCHEIQNLGAVQTYQRRYLYTTALEIVEFDALDAVTGKEGQPPNKKLTEGQVKRLWAISKQAGVDIADVKKAILKYGVSQAEDLSRQQYDELCKRLEKASA